MEPTQFAGLGDSIECHVRSPRPGTIRMRLLTPEACAHANDLLLDRKSGWRLVNDSASNEKPHDDLRRRA